jgi:glycosyltransferase involved in cell wall biosynthesis
MRILLTGDHTYPMSAARSAGRAVTSFPSGSAQRLQDWTAKALAELGHEVVYCIAGGVAAPAPPGVTVVESLDLRGVDVAHISATNAPRFEPHFLGAGLPYISVLHIHPDARPFATPRIRNLGSEAVFVSRWLATSLGSTRFVHNGVDPSEYLFSAEKSDYLLFMTSMDWADGKGIDLAISVAQRAGMRLVVAGSARHEAAIENAARLCDRPGVDFIGDVQGDEKRTLLAGAYALLHPSTYAEACPLTILEAMVSGTPVLATPWGGTPELVSDDTGFLCVTEDEFVDALGRAGGIDPQACRARALRDFHYHRMARDYIREYEAAMAAGCRSFTTPAAQTSIQ